MPALTYNGTIVPWTTNWTGEEADYHFAPCRLALGRLVMRQKNSPGEGRPVFGSVHMDRQRKAIIQGRCDVCGSMIRPHQARVLLHPGNQLQGTNENGHVMAPCHRECARKSAEVCPWIVAEIKAGRLVVSVVKKSEVALAQLDPDVVEAETGIFPRSPVYGHAKLIVRKSMSRDADWLTRAAVN